MFVFVSLFVMLPRLFYPKNHFQLRMLQRYYSAAKWQLGALRMFISPKTGVQSGTRIRPVWLKSNSTTDKSVTVGQFVLFLSLK